MDSRRALAVVASLVSTAALVAWLRSSNDSADTSEPPPGQPPPRPASAARPAPAAPPAFAGTAPAPGAPAPLPQGDDDDEAALALPSTDGGLLPADGAPPTQAGLEARVRAALAENARSAERHLERFCAESRRLRELAPFQRAPPKRDAALFLNGRVDWETTPSNPGGQVGTLHLPDALLARVKPDDAWLTVGEAELAGLDFGWMGQLHEFDHWSLTAVGPLQDRDHSYVSAPLPNYLQLMPWAKLRLARGLADGDLERASRDVRQLGTLIATNGSLISEMIRNRLYALERTAWERAGRPPAAGLPTKDELARYRAVARGAVKFLAPGVPAEVQKKALACAPARCTMVHEAVGVATALRAVSPDAEATAAWLRQESGCDAHLVTALEKAGPASPSELRALLDGDSPLDSLLDALDGGL
ncbi:MAG: hypothetical protein INH41_05255 [Myxococcaceae bacterium]|jgi:hypothetical protein|nr:hypothetical protein [Myxococcaceae bacterium]MCA3011792.1 hypothetical protein [Myxococcaceae bacterium]